MQQPVPIQQATPTPQPVPLPTPGYGPYPVRPSGNFSPFSPAALQVNVTLSTPAPGETPQHAMFTTAVAMGRALRERGEPSVRPPTPLHGVPHSGVNRGSGGTSTVLDYDQTTVLAFAYELDPDVDSDPAEIQRLAEYIKCDIVTVQVGPDQQTFLILI